MKFYFLFNDLPKEEQNKAYEYWAKAHQPNDKRRIWRLLFKHNGVKYQAEVGKVLEIVNDKPKPRGFYPEPVAAIFHGKPCGVMYMTNATKGPDGKVKVGFREWMVGDDEVIDVEYFEDYS